MHFHVGLMSAIAMYLMWLILHFFHLTIAHVLGDRPIGQALGYLA